MVATLISLSLAAPQTTTTNTPTIQKNNPTSSLQIYHDSLIGLAKQMNSEIADINKKYPVKTSDSLRQEYKNISDTIIDRKYQVSDSLLIFERREKLSRIIEEYSSASIKFDQINTRKRELDAQILQISLMLDLQKKDASEKARIDSVNSANHANDLIALNTFATSVREIKETVYSNNAIMKVAASIVIFDQGTNEKFIDWVQTGINALGVASLIFSYNGIQDDEGGQAIGFGAAAGGIYAGGQFIITSLKNNNSKAKSAFEALSRNAIYGNLIREDTLARSEIQATVDSLSELIAYKERTNFKEVDDNWRPTADAIRLSHLLVEQLQQTTIFWQKVAVASNDLLKSSKDYLTEAGRNALVDNSNNAVSVIAIRSDNLIRFQSKLNYIENAAKLIAKDN